MEFQNCILIHFEHTHGRTHTGTDGQAENNMPFNFSKVGGIKNMCANFQTHLLKHTYFLLFGLRLSMAY